MCTFKYALCSFVGFNPFVYCHCWHFNRKHVCKLQGTCDRSTGKLTNTLLTYFAEQECHLLEDSVDNPHHLDQKPGFEVRGKGTDSCTMTLAECKNARLALDWKADAVQEIAEQNKPTGCYRQQEEDYRFEDDKSSYKWYFNSATTSVQPDSKTEPVCKGKSKLSCL